MMQATAQDQRGHKLLDGRRLAGEILGFIFERLRAGTRWVGGASPSEVASSTASSSSRTPLRTSTFGKPGRWS